MSFKRAIRVLLAAALMLALFGMPALAKVVSPGSDFYYLDKANVLDEALEGEIYFSNRLLDEACGAQVVVVTLDTVGGQSIDEYAYDLFNQWGIGDSKQKNGFLLLLAIGDEDYYAMSGANLDSKLSSSTLKRYFDDYLEDDFAAGNYASGVKKFFEAVFERIATTYNANVTTQQGIDAYKRYVSSQNSGSSGQGFGGYSNSKPSGDGKGLIVLVLIIVLLLVMSRRRRRASYGSYAQSARPSGWSYGSGHSSGIPWFIAGQLFGRARSNAQRPSYHRPTSYYHRPSSGGSSGSSGFFSGMFGSGSGGGFKSSGRSGGFGGARGGGGSTRGGGAGRGRH